jgi:hypothetical protein
VIPMQRRRQRSVLYLTIVLALSSFAVAGDGRGGGDSARRVGCIDVWPEARYRNYAYDHIVHLRSRCRMRVVCDVTTNVNPSSIRVSVPPGQEIEVVTFRGSPARDFQPSARCQLRDRPSKTSASIASLSFGSADFRATYGARPALQ